MLFNPIPFVVGIGIVAGIAAAAGSQSVREPIRVGERVATTFLTDCAPPIYPAEAQERRLEGEVRLEVAVDPDGIVTSVQVDTGDPVLRPAAREAVSAWRFEGMRLNGESVPVITYVTLTFSIPSGDEAADAEPADDTRRCYRSVPEP